MRICIWTVGTLLMNLGCAHATTYQLTYTGKQLVQAYPDLPIKGAKHLVFVIQSATPFPKNTCFHVPFASVTYFSDGKDTLATLAAAGYSNDNYSMLSLCTDQTARHVLSWSGGYELKKIAGNYTNPDYFDIYSYSSPPGNTTYYDIAQISIAKKRESSSGYKVYTDENTSAAGVWKWKIMNP